MKRLILLVFVLMSIIHLSQAQLSGGGDLNPDLKAPKEAQERWMDRRVGLSVHWGPSALGAEEISWSRDSRIKKEFYDNFYKQFNPVKFDANEWVWLMKRWGIKYMSPTGKHHDGFCLWYSDYTPYDMENAKRKIDIMAELSKACKKNDIMFGSYYSNLDWYHPDWAPYQYGGPGPLIEKQKDSPNLERYYRFMENQVIELIEKYGVEFIQFDGEWDDTYTHEVGSRLYRRFHEVKPDVLLSSRIDIGRRSEGSGNHLYMDGQKYAGDYQERERLVNHGNNITSWLDHPWQAWVTIDKTQWGYNHDPVLMTGDELILDMVSVVGNNGNYMINLGPRPDGSFEAEQIALMDELGLWLNKHQKAIYGTRGGPFYPFKHGVSTRKGKKAWLMITDQNVDKLYLPKLQQQIVNARVFGTDNKVAFSVHQDLLSFELTGIQYEGPVTVIELEFDEEVEMGPKMKKELNIFEVSGLRRLFEGISYNTSSNNQKWHFAKDEPKLFLEINEEDYAFHTQEEINPYVIFDLSQEEEVHGLMVKNRKACCQDRAKNLSLWTSNDGKQWTKQWQAKEAKEEWSIVLTTKSMGAEVPGVKTRYIKLGLSGEGTQILHLNKVSIYAK
ncbi:alpha-L-fucosidase [Rapidithrix thailandica]|uniref:alpha-L-fucosidase n=1 Tax=Rapidithrix thailandica TaxID=413964 RepID=A0AAW9S697_9BACT